jgi:cation diffusion facilitator CzcD-associated flavoprotein CzcO
MAQTCDGRGMADICIIGAGSSGLITAKVLKAKGLAFDCYEKGSDTGGMWRYENDNGASSCYRSLHIDTSVKNLAYSDHPSRRARRTFPPIATCSAIWRASPSASACASTSPFAAR